MRGDGADDVVEGDFLVGEGVQDDLADVSDQGGEGGAGIDADAHGQGVDEEPDQASGVRVITSGDGGSDGEVAAAGMAGQEEGIEGEQDHEVGGFRCRAGGVEPGGGLRAGGDGGAVAGEVSAAGSGAVGCGAGRLGAVQVLGPPREIVAGPGSHESRAARRSSRHTG